MPSDRIKEINKEAHAPTSTEDLMDQESLEKNLTEGDEKQQKLRRSNRIKSIMEDKIKEQDLLSHFTYYDFIHEDDYDLQDRMDIPIEFEATNFTDTMHYHESMKASDRGEFIKAMVKEI